MSGHPDEYRYCLLMLHKMVDEDAVDMSSSVVVQKEETSCYRKKDIRDDSVNVKGYIGL